MRKAIIILLPIVLIGCAGSILSYKMMDETKMVALPTAKLCLAYHHTKKVAAKDELIRRNAIPENEWPLIESGRVTIGMSIYGLFCSWGVPTVFGTANRTITENGVHVQLVYREYLKKTRYVYTLQQEGQPPDSAKVVGIQD